MNKRLSLLALTLLAGFSLNAVAVESNEVKTLTDEQKKHEETMQKLRMQKALIEVKHEQAKLLKDCRDMGISCSPDEDFNAMPDPMTDLDMMGEPEQAPFQMIAGTPPQGNGMGQPDLSPDMADGMPIPMESGAPELTAIQNKSAQLSMGENTQWYAVGDKAGPWKIVYISATKVRLQHAHNDSVKTLLMNW